MENEKIVLINRNNLSISGIKKVIEINEDNLCLEVSDKDLFVGGQNIEVKKLDVESGILEVCGEINLIKFAQKHKKIGFFKKIFK